MKIANLFQKSNPKKRIGILGEKAAVGYLRRHGYRILSRNFKRPPHELDIVAKEKGGTLVFVEVKTRTLCNDTYNTYGSAAAAVTRAKQKSLLSAARAYLLEHKTELPCRFDVIEVYVSDNAKIVELNHIKGAFFA